MSFLVQSTEQLCEVAKQARLREGIALGVPSPPSEPPIGRAGAAAVRSMAPPPPPPMGPTPPRGPTRGRFGSSVVATASGGRRMSEPYAAPMSAQTGARPQRSRSPAKAVPLPPWHQPRREQTVVGQSPPPPLWQRTVAPWPVEAPEEPKATA